MDLLWKAVLSGVLFGCWPLLISKTGLSGSSAAFYGGLVSFMFVAPFALTNGISVAGTQWWIILITGSMAGIGGLAFNDMMVKAKVETSAMLFVIMLVVQILMPAMYHVAVNQQFSLRTLAGFITAVAACILLSSK